MTTSKSQSLSVLIEHLSYLFDMRNVPEALQREDFSMDLVVRLTVKIVLLLKERLYDIKLVAGSD